jgi:hypothetical protein
VGTQQRPVREYRLDYGGACGFCPVHPVNDPKWPETAM